MPHYLVLSAPFKLVKVSLCDCSHFYIVKYKLFPVSDLCVQPIPQGPHTALSSSPCTLPFSWGFHHPPSHRTETLTASSPSHADQSPRRSVSFTSQIFLYHTPPPSSLFSSILILPCLLLQPPKQSPCLQNCSPKIYPPHSRI